MFRFHTLIIAKLSKLISPTKKMYLYRLSIVIPLYCFFNHTLFSVALLNSPALHYPLDDFAVNCGSSGNSTALNGRQWIGDIGSKYIISQGYSKGKMISTTIDQQPLSPDPVPYKTARISRRQFTYTFRVSPGQKFIRLHFFPTSYPGFKRSKSFFTVKAGPYTLLNNFSASFTADALGLQSFVKEFCVNVEDNQPLIISFSPTPGATCNSDEVYAFVNGIEIVSMPPGLYHTRQGDHGAHVVGKKYPFYIDESIALEMVQRLNVGGSSISSIEDTAGMFREWSDDSNYLLESRVLPVSTTVRIKYTSIPNYTAPQKVYQTSWSMVPEKQANKAFNFTWKIQVDLGFRYLVRFHFCELGYEIKESGHTQFNIFVDNEIAEANADLITWSTGSGVAEYRDYVVTVGGDRMEGKRDLLIALCPHSYDLRTEHTDSILKGLEVFKLSNPDNILAGLNPVSPIHASTSSSNQNPRKSVLARGGNVIATGVVILIAVLNIIVYQLRILAENSDDNNTSSLPSEGSCRRFSLAEVQSVTNNFDYGFVIGRGGFGMVYKGVIVNGGGATTVAIKRLNSESKQGANEFWTEIEMFSKLRHTHLVSLIGYCDEGNEMILVYDYMEHGTLADHLYKINTNGNSNICHHLSWEVRLNICIGAARGLDYLHTGSRHGVIHRDVKTTNILLDKDWVAKISDFGLCKMGATSHSRSHVSTDVKGTYGYLDPEYYWTRRLTKKTDVYALGVVLLEVLCGRPAVDTSLEEQEQHSLASWAQRCIKEGKLDKIIDPSLKDDKVSNHCLKVFAEVANRCLHPRPEGRPTMADVVSRLEYALASQDHCGVSSTEESVDNDDEEKIRSDDDLPLSLPQGTVPSPTIPVQDNDNIPQGKKRSNGKLSKVFRRSINALLPKGMDISWGKRKIHNSNSGWSQWDGDAPLCHCFSKAEIQAATGNFASNLVIGRGDLGTVYKGYVNGGATSVAIRQLKSWLIQVDPDEFLTQMGQIEILSQLRHHHLVSLIGYCNYDREIVLVYNYMSQGTLDDHLYDPNPNKPPLSWKQRLQICIDAAKGLDYLHAGANQKIIHGNMKTTNILLDDKWVAKVSDFGLSKINPYHGFNCNRKRIRTFKDTNDFLHSKVGLLQQNTEKCDVNSFGLVLVEVLCARSIPNPIYNLGEWARLCYEKGRLCRSVDPYLVGKIAPNCLTKFEETAMSCLHPVELISMKEVVSNLELALQLQLQE